MFFIFYFVCLRTTGDTGFEPDNYYEPRQRYSLSDMLTHIKRSIPDLRNIKHQPLENKEESPCGSPKHAGDNGAGTSSILCKFTNTRQQNAFTSEFGDGGGGIDKDNAITLSAIQTTSCQVRGMTKKEYRDDAFKTSMIKTNLICNFLLDAMWSIEKCSA